MSVFSETILSLGYLSLHTDGIMEFTSASKQKKKKKNAFPLTNNNGKNGEEHKSISYEESFDVIFSDVPHSL